jgi:hypothetical protein
MGGISIDKVRAGRDKSISYSIICKREMVKRRNRVVLTDQQYIISKIRGFVMLCIRVHVNIPLIQFGIMMDFLETLSVKQPLKCITHKDKVFINTTVIFIYIHILYI